MESQKIGDQVWLTSYYYYEQKKAFYQTIPSRLLRFPYSASPLTAVGNSAKIDFGLCTTFILALLFFSSKILWELLVLSQVFQSSIKNCDKYPFFWTTFHFPSIN